MKRTVLAKKAGTMKRLHVDRKVLAANKKYNRHRPALTIQTSAGPIKAHYIRILGDALMVHSDRALSCGARAWVETKARLLWA